MSRAYYNEIDPHAAQWLRNLIAAGHIAPGDVDERSITDVRSGDLDGYGQCHFFAGIGGWSHALRLSGWSDTRPVWTGSCPCQPFSTAGLRKGFDDARHLWPAWFRLIDECGPPVVFGEQVDSPDSRHWLDLVSADLEGRGYAIGAAVLPAASVGAPHARHRVFYVADAARSHDGRSRAEPRPRQEQEPRDGGRAQDLADANGQSSIGAAKSRQERGPWGCEPGVAIVADGVSYSLAQPAIRALGNAIVPQVAAAFIDAFASIAEAA